MNQGSSISLRKGRRRWNCFSKPWIHIVHLRSAKCTSRTSVFDSQREIAFNLTIVSWDFYFALRLRSSSLPTFQFPQHAMNIVVLSVSIMISKSYLFVMISMWACVVDEFQDITNFYILCDQHLIHLRDRILLQAEPTYRHSSSGEWARG